MTKMIYWRCTDCGSMINDDNMHEFDIRGHHKWRKYAEFCYGCMQYNPEVVLAYA